MINKRKASPLEPEQASDEQVAPATNRGQLTPTVDSFEGTWWVLHTRSRNEKVVAAHLARSGIQHFLPLVRLRRTYGGTIHQVSIPLFPGYLFLCGGPEDRYRALQTNRLANVLEVADQDRLGADLRQIERVVNSSEPVDLFPGLQVGSRCRITSGSLVGLEGVVLRRRGPWRVYIGVAFVGQSAELEIDAAMLEMLD